MSMNVCPSCVRGQASEEGICPPGGQILSAYGFDSFFQASGGGTLNQLQVTFSSPSQISQKAVQDIMKAAYAQTTAQGEEILAYALCRRVVSSIEVPTQVCIPNTEVCFDVPDFLAGRVLTEVYEYRLTLLSKPASVGAYAVRGAIGALGIVGIIMAGMAAVFLVVALAQWQAGELSAQDALNLWKGIIKAPGEAISGPIQAAAWPFVALGIALVGASIAIPALSTNIGIRAPIGPIQLEAGAGTGGGRRR